MPSASFSAELANRYGVVLGRDALATNQDVFRFFKQMIAFRTAHPSIGRRRFWRNDVSWHGIGQDPDLSFDSHTLAYQLRGGAVGDDDLYVMINSYWQALDFTIQVDASQVDNWLRVADTSLDSPADIAEPGQEIKLTSLTYSVGPRSVVVLRRHLERKLAHVGEERREPRHERVVILDPVQRRIGEDEIGPLASIEAPRGERFDRADLEAQAARQRRDARRREHAA